jgi:hypothetical protein
MNGIIQSYMDVLVPGQKIVLDLQVISGTWPSSVTPSTIEFTRLADTAAITMTVSVPPETPVTENNLISLMGHWRLDPGTNEGEMPPYTMGIHVMPYSRVNITVDDNRKTGTIGDDVEFRTTLHNNGNMIDHYRVYVEWDGDCVAETNDLNVTVQVSGTADAVIVVRQEKGSPGTKRFVVHAIGMYRGNGEHAKMDLFLETKLGPAAFLTQPWSLLIAGILMLFAAAISYFGGSWFLRRRRIRSIRHRGK